MEIIKDPNTLIGKGYNHTDFHCWTFIEECLNVPTLKDVAVATAIDDVKKLDVLFTEIEKPINNCIILIGKSHVGIYYKNGAYHNDTHGVRWESLRTLKLRYKGLKYYDVYPN